MLRDRSKNLNVTTTLLVLKYLYSQVYTEEIPRELSLGIAMLGCDIHCPECHSPHTWDINCKGYGIDLTTDELDKLIKKQPWVSCILFFGGEWDTPSLESLLLYVRKNYEYRLALYSGRNLDFFSQTTVPASIDYLKVGPYVKERGGLIYPSTNQRLYRLEKGKIVEDMTSLFWRTNIR